VTLRADRPSGPRPSPSRSDAPIDVADPVEELAAPGPSGRSAPTSLEVLTAASIIGAVAAASIAWSRLFADVRGPIVCVLAAVVSGAIVAVRRRGSWAWTALISVVALVVVAAVSTVPLAGVALPTPDALRTVLGWVPSMTATTLESGLPADSHGPPLLLALTATWLAAAVATGLAVHRRARALALLSPVGLWVLALLLGSPRPTSPIALSVPVISAVIVFLAISGLPAEGLPSSTPDPASPSGPKGWTWTASVTRRLLALGGVVAVAVLAASLLPSTGRAPSLQREPEFDPRQVISPLTQVYPQIVAEQPRELFAVRGAADDLDRITLAVLDEFNGETWQSAGAFRPVGEVAAPDPRPDDALERHRISVEIRGLEGPWLPHPGRVERIRLRGMQSDGADRNHVWPAGTTDGMTYEVESTVVTRTGLQDLVTSAAAGAVDPAWTELPTARTVDDDLGDVRACTVSEIVEVARGWTQGVSASGQGVDDQLAQVSEIETRLREEHGRNTEDEAYGPGHTLSDMCRVLGIGPGGTPRPASDEQFASLMATMVRGLGIPARVAVGYRLPEERSEGERVVTEHDAAAWTEVHLGAAGWVAFEPTPASETSADSETRTVTNMAPSPVPPAPPVTEPPVDPPPTTLPPSVDPDVARTTDSVIGTVVVGGPSVIALLVAGGFGAIVAYKRRRRLRRRRAEVPNDAVAGAWFEVIDHLRDRGFDPPSGLTERELAAQAAAATGRPHLRQPMTDLSRLFGRAVYSTQPLDDATPTTAWQLVDGIEHDTNQNSGLVDRIRARASLRSLRKRVG
jgi:hypothetical protein